ncbi:MAG: toll/interleukin-1 receptor domain-containing protein [Bryobacteraceae bacterium]
MMAVQAQTFDLFISYRRENGAAEARLLRERLMQDGWRVFLDVADLKKGYFDEALLEYIASAPNFLVVLSPRSLDRCVSEQDWLRREIEHAIATGRNIIPVMLPGFAWPAELPEQMQSLPRHQGLDYSHVYFDAMIQRIDESMRLERDDAERRRREREREQREREAHERELKRKERVPPPVPKPSLARPVALVAAVVALAAGLLLWRRGDDSAAQTALGEGRTYLMTRQWNEALRKFATVPASDPAYKDALQGQVQALTATSRWELAADAQRKIIALEPDRAANHYEIGSILCLATDYPSALVAFRQAAQRDPANKSYRDAIADVEQKLAPPKVELPPVEQMKIEPPKPESAKTRSTVPEMIGIYEAAFGKKPEVPKKSPPAPAVTVKEDDEAVVNHANALAKAGRLDEAEAEIRRALRISPNVVSYRFMRRDLAQILEKKGDLDGALREMALAVMLWPKDALYEYDYYGSLLEKKGDFEGALAQYKIAAKAPAYRGNYDRLRQKLGR